MNICLTTECNNHCPYCFQKELHGCKEEFTLENIEKVLNWCKDDIINWRESISLLGGEPTCYSQLFEVMNIIQKELGIGTPILIISNLLCSENIINKFSTYQNIGFLINTSYDLDKENIFLNNLSKLDKTNAALSITLMRNPKTNKYYSDRLIKLLNDFTGIKSIRIGLMCPGNGDSWDTIYNYESDLDYLINNVPLQNLNEITFDCPVNMCQISDEYYYKLIDIPQVKGLKKTCYGPPFDILPNLSAKYCYSSGKKYTINNIFDFKTYREAKNYLTENGTDNFIIQNTKCKLCELYIQGKCHPCHSIDASLVRGINK